MKEFEDYLEMEEQPYNEDIFDTVAEQLTKWILGGAEKIVEGKINEEAIKKKVKAMMAKSKQAV